MKEDIEGVDEEIKNAWKTVFRPFLGTGTPRQRAEKAAHLIDKNLIQNFDSRSYDGTPPVGSHNKNSKFSDKEAAIITESLRRTDDDYVMGSLRLSESELTDDGAKAIAQVIRVKPSILEWLSLENNRIGDDGIVELAKAICPSSLQYLMVDDNPYGLRGQRALNDIGFRAVHGGRNSYVRVKNTRECGSIKSIITPTSTKPGQSSDAAPGPSPGAGPSPDTGSAPLN